MSAESVLLERARLVLEKQGDRFLFEQFSAWMAGRWPASLRPRSPQQSLRLRVSTFDPPSIAGTWLIGLPEEVRRLIAEHGDKGQPSGLVLELTPDDAEPAIVPAERTEHERQ
jgi:hypothetical protein